MDGTDIIDFLEANGTGVLSLAKGDDSYAVPVSYAYDQDDRRVYFRLGYGPGSQKQKYLEATDHATFVVYDRTETGWKSVVASGHLQELSESDIEASLLESLKSLDIPFFRVFERPSDEIDFTIVALEIDSLNGRIEAQ